MATLNEDICRKYTKGLSKTEGSSDVVVFLNQTTANNSSYATNSTSLGGHSKELNHYVSFEWFEIVIPIVCLVGIMGNTLNLAVLTRRRHVSGMDRLGRTANCGLVALAFSDLLFCLTVFPFTFITSATSRIPELKVLFLYYKLYGIASVNLFIMISTWLIVTMAIKRYLVVVYPLHARDMITTRRTYFLLVLVYIVSGVITLPHYLRLRVVPCYSPAGVMEQEYRQRWPPEVDTILKMYIRWIWPIIADFIPIIILVVCNYRLVKELNSAKMNRKSTCQGQKLRDPGQKINLILVIIVLTLLVLVSPAEILKYCNPYRAWGKTGYVVASVTNVLQTVNFAVNFMLYLVVSAKFRSTTKSLLRSNCSSASGKVEEHQSQKSLAANCSVRNTSRTWGPHSYGSEV